MKKLIVVVVVLAAVGIGAGAYYRNRQVADPQVTSVPITRGDVIDAVAATGTLEAVETVDVGTQVSGTVQELYADFNDIVRKGQIIARLDPSLIQTQIEQQEANVIRAQADLERLQVNLADAHQKLERAKQMWDKNLIPRTDLETAEVNVNSAKAQIRSSEASLVQARASLNNQKVNLDHTVITAPIDGIVIQRSVDQGQTVAASMNAPTLFILAADLTKMQVLANIDESEVGRMRPGQHVTFRVDAYPTDTFIGNVEQVRLQPTVVQNVVTYSTVISVPNPELKLKPGMTANVNVEVAHRSNVLRLPSAALRFRPTDEMFQVLNQEVPPEARGGRGGMNAGGFGGGRGRDGQGQPGGGAPGGPPPAAGQQAQARPQGAPGAAPAGAGDGEGRGTEARQGGFGGGRGGFDPNMTTEERRKAMEERMAAMTPEERERFQAARGRRGEGGQPGAPGAGNAPAGQRRDNSRGITAGITPGPTHQSGATTIDALFGPLPVVESRGRAWIYVENKLQPVALRLGVTDGSFTEIISGDITEGQDVVTGMTTGLEPRAGASQQPNNTQNPLMGPQRGGRGGPGGGGGRGR